MDACCFVPFYFDGDIMEEVQKISIKSKESHDFSRLVDFLIWLGKPVICRNTTIIHKL